MASVSIATAKIALLDQGNSLYVPDNRARVIYVKQKLEMVAALLVPCGGLVSLEVRWATGCSHVPHEKGFHVTARAHSMSCQVNGWVDKHCDSKQSRYRTQRSCITPEKRSSRTHRVQCRMISSSSTSKFNVEFGGITGGKPRVP